MDYHIFTMVTEGAKKHCLSILPQKEVEEKGLLHKAVVGYLPSAKPDPEGFEENPFFKEQLHEFIRQALPAQADFLAAGKKTDTGYVYLIDRRTKNAKGDVPMQDVIGAINFEKGNVVHGSYLPNKNYKLFTSKGLFQLPFALEEKLLGLLKQQ